MLFFLPLWLAQSEQSAQSQQKYKKSVHLTFYPYLQQLTTLLKPIQWNKIAIIECGVNIERVSVLRDTLIDLIFRA